VSLALGIDGLQTNGSQKEVGKGGEGESYHRDINTDLLWKRAPRRGEAGTHHIGTAENKSDGPSVDLHLRHHVWVYRFVRGRRGRGGRGETDICAAISKLDRKDRPVG
jgi:hypothetical protein